MQLQSMTIHRKWERERMREDTETRKSPVTQAFHGTAAPKSPKLSVCAVRAMSI